MAHAHPRVVHVPGDLFHGGRHVAGVQDDVVVLRLQDVGELLRQLPLVEALFDAVDVGQVETGGEGQQPRDRAAGHGHDRAAVHAAGEERAHLDVADQLPAHRAGKGLGHLLGRPVAGRPATGRRRESRRDSGAPPAAAPVPGVSCRYSPGCKSKTSLKSVCGAKVF